MIVIYKKKTSIDIMIQCKMYTILYHDTTRCYKASLLAPVAIQQEHNRTKPFIRLIS